MPDRLQHLANLRPHLEDRQSLRYVGAGIWNLMLLWGLLSGIWSFLTGCSRPESRVDIGNREQILHIGNASEPEDLDPQIVTGVPEHRLLMSLFEGLVTEDPYDLHPVPGVAERWDISPDGRTYTFYLRKNARWSNGDPVTARDFLNSYKRILSPELGARYAYMFYVVKSAEPFNKGKITDFNEVGFKAPEDYIFVITLENPTSYFLSLMLHTSWFPVHLPTIEKHGNLFRPGNRWTRPGNHVGNGTFMLDKWRVNDVVSVKRNPYHWDAKHVRLNQIRFYPIESDQTEERAFRLGQLHVTYVVPLTKLDSYRANKPDLLRITPYLGTYFYRVNTTKPPLNDKRVRLALAMAIDRESLVKNVTRGDQKPATHFTPPDTAGYNAIARLRSELGKARQLLAEAGFPNGKGFPKLELLYNTQEAHRDVAQAIQQMWRKNLGIDVTLVNQEWKVYLAAQRQLNYDVCRAGWISDYIDPKSFLDLWVTDGGQNETGWSNAEYDRLIKAADEALTQEQRYAIYQKAEALFLEEVPAIPIYFYTRPALIHPALKGWHPNLLDYHPYKYVYLSNDVQSVAVQSRTDILSVFATRATAVGWEQGQNAYRTFLPRKRQL
jgi:oligopeptide transport system substrate-binding protein